MRIIIVRANETWEIADIEKGFSLWRKILGGDYEYVETGFSGINMYCNDCGKIKRLPVNNLAAKLRKHAYNMQDYVAGDVIVVGADNEGNSCSLTDEQVDELTRKLKGESPFSKEVTDQLLDEIDDFLIAYGLDYYTEIMVGETGYFAMSERTDTEVSMSRFLYKYHKNEMLSKDEIEFLVDELGDDDMARKIESNFEENSDTWANNHNILDDKDSILDSTEFDAYDEYVDIEEELETEEKADIENYCFIDAKESKMVTEIVTKFYELLDKYGLEASFLSDTDVFISKKE